MMGMQLLAHNRLISWQDQERRRETDDDRYWICQQPILDETIKVNKYRNSIVFNIRKHLSNDPSNNTMTLAAHAEVVLLLQLNKYNPQDNNTTQQENNKGPNVMVEILLDDYRGAF